MIFTIRQESPSDYQDIREVNILAFNNQENEAKLVELIRQSENFIPQLSLVAESENQEIIGHILISTITIVTENGKISTLGLAPMAVKPGYQNKGIGSALVSSGLEACQESGYKHIFVLGHPNFYPRFGFVSSKANGINPPFPVPDEVFMALELESGSLSGMHGRIEYPAAFNAVT
ncbi:MAG: N-acetyltransferase [Mesobacillus sp.]|uniref:GNAT family N-acetyltransferase n=1 Tax=Mesobacillus sp. TaxID=2675271 RepID=UPI003C67B70B